MLNQTWKTEHFYFAVACAFVKSQFHALINIFFSLVKHPPLWPWCRTECKHQSPFQTCRHPGWTRWLKGHLSSFRRSDGGEFWGGTKNWGSLKVLNNTKWSWIGWWLPVSPKSPRSESSFFKGFDPPKTHERLSFLGFILLMKLMAKYLLHHDIICDTHSSWETENRSHLQCDVMKLFNINSLFLFQGDNSFFFFF